MKTQRFETFFDAILAIIITVLVLKIAQPAAPTLDGVWNLNGFYLTYFMCFLIIFNMWHGNHNLFQIVDEIDTKSLIYYGLLIFSRSLLPYFSVWLSLNIYSVPAQTMFGINFMISYLFYLLSINAVFNMNQTNVKLDAYSFLNKHTFISLIPIIAGFIVTYTTFTPGIY